MGSIRKILVPTDFSPHAEEAFRQAFSLAKATGASVVVLHVAQARLSSLCCFSMLELVFCKVRIAPIGPSHDQ